MNKLDYNLKQRKLSATISQPQLIAAGVSFVLSTDAATTPKGVTWKDSGGTTITGTLEAKTVAEQQGTHIYLVPGDKTYTQNIKREFVAVHVGSGTTTSDYIWEQIGDTEIDLKDVVKDVTLNKQTDVVLGESTTFSNSASSVSFSGGATDTFVKSITADNSKKLVTASITGTNGTVSVSQVSATEQTATNTVFGTDTSASKITTASKTATNTVFGTNTSASAVSGGTSKDVAKAGTAVGFKAFDSALTNVLYNATYTAATETLSLSQASTVDKSIVPAVANGNITGSYTISPVTVPVVTSNTGVTFNAVATNNDVVVPVVSSNDTIKADKVTINNVNAAKVASSAVTVATGELATTGTGDAVVTGLNNPTTASAVTSIGTGTAAAQTITVGTNDKVTALTNSTSITVTKAGQ